MNSKEFASRSLFKLTAITDTIISGIRISLWRLKGMEIGSNCQIRKIYATWPHKISLGSGTILERGVFFKYDGIYSPGKSILIGKNTFIGNHCEFNISGKITIGDTCLISSGCKFIDHDHGIQLISTINIQRPVISNITIGNDVWIGANSIILKGACIGSGAVVAAGSVVLGNVGENEVVGGIPARLLKRRQ